MSLLSQTFSPKQNTENIETKSKALQKYYRSGTVNSNTANSKFHLIQSFCEMFCYHFAIIPCLKCMVNSYFHLIRRKFLLTNDFELTELTLYDL